MTDARITHEIETNPVAARLDSEEGRWVLTMQRRLRHSPDRVWPMLTVPEQLARWSPFVPDRTLDSTGPATARENPDDPPREAEVLVLDAPRELVHRYGDDLLRWTLVADGDGTLLTLHHTLDGSQPAPAIASGWHICFGTLAALEVDERVTRVVGSDAMDYGWAKLRDAYDALWAAS
jgi:uncharacterized protein YndB with AHSA1/START domain